MKHSIEKYHWDGLELLERMKSLHPCELYIIYFHKWVLNKMLSINIGTKFEYKTEFEDFTYEEACHHYSRFKNEINIK